LATIHPATEYVPFFATEMLPTNAATQIGLISEAKLCQAFLIRWIIHVRMTAPITATMMV
jgi:hypothetical protein